MRILLVISAILGSSAFAENSLIGTWKIEKFECSSGAAHHGFGGNIDGGVDATAVISDTTIATTFDLHMKYKSEYAEPVLKQFAGAIATTEARAESADKQTTLGELKKSLGLIETYAKGIRCTTKEVLSYSVSGDVLRTASTKQRSSDCPGDENSAADVSESKFEVSGDLLKITETTPEKADSACPVGDFSITRFRRVK